MAVIETWFEQDLKKPVKVHYIDGNLFSHNGNGNLIGVRVTDNGEPATLSGTVSGYVVISDGTTVPCTGSRSGNNCSILIPAAAYQPGAVFITVFLTDNTTVTTLASVATSVLQARTGTQVDPGSVVSDWTDTINAAMQAVETAAENLGGIIAVPYANITFPVPLGEYTYNNGYLYRCIVPIATSEEFTAAHWTQVRLGDDVTHLKSALSLISEDQNLFNSSDITENVRINGAGSTQTDTGSYTSGYIPVEPGKTYAKNSPTVDNGHRAFGYYANKAAISSADFNTSNVFTIPANCAYIRFCGKLTEVSTATFVLVSAKDVVARDDLKAFEDKTEETIGTLATKNELLGWKRYNDYKSKGSGNRIDVTNGQGGLPGKAIFASGGKTVFATKDNLFNNILYQGTLNSSTGEYAAYAGAVCTDFYPIKPNDLMWANGSYTSGMNPTLWIFWYKSDKSFINYSSIISGVSVPSNAAFARLRFYLEPSIAPSDILSCYFGSNAIGNIAYNDTLVQGTIGQSTGKFIANYADAVCTGFIQCSANTYYYIRWLSDVFNGNVYVFAYSSNDEDTWLSPAIEFKGNNFVTPANTAYVRIRFYNNSPIAPSDISKHYLGSNTSDRDPTNAVPYTSSEATVYFEQPLPSFEQPNENFIIYSLDGSFSLYTSYEAKTFYLTSQWDGKKLYTFGDSITNMERWQADTVKLLNLASYQKKAVSGGTLHLIYPQISDTPADCEIMTFWMGTNDYQSNNGMSLGAITDDFSQYDSYTTDAQREANCTFYGCLKYCCNWLSTNRPDDLQVLFITPLQRNDQYAEAMGEAYGYDDLGYPKNKFEKTLEQYANAVIEVAHLYGYPVLDMYHESGANLITCDTLMIDGLHPSWAFGAVIGRKVAKRLLDL